MATQDSTTIQGNVKPTSRSIADLPTPATRPAAGSPIPPWMAIAPFAIAAVLALLPVPSGLAQNAWYFFSIFVGVIVALVLEPLPGAAIALIGLTLAMVRSSNLLTCHGYRSSLTL
jgi:L-tartrate/succinate antiporter